MESHIFLRHRHYLHSYGVGVYQDVNKFSIKSDSNDIINNYEN